LKPVFSLKRYFIERLPQFYTYYLHFYFFTFCKNIF
jgi:hypothetical protein